MTKEKDAKRDLLIPLSFPPVAVAVCTVHLSRCTSWLSPWPPPPLSGVSTLAPRGTTACGQNCTCAGCHLASKLHCGAQCTASHYQASGVANCGQNCGASTNHKGLSSSANYQGLSSLRSLSFASSS